MSFRRTLSRVRIGLLLGLMGLMAAQAGAAQFGSQQKADIVSDGTYFAGAFLFGADGWDRSFNGNGSSTLIFSLPSDQWVGLYLYDYPGAAWAEAAYAWRSPASTRLPAMLSVGSVTFTMGRRDDGPDAWYGADDELPRHEVALSPYQIGATEVTNGQYADMLNWALGQGYLENESGGAYESGDVYINGEILIEIEDEECEISFDGAAFVVETRDGIALGDYPVIEVSWYGAAAYCNWLSEQQAMTPVYDLATWEVLDANPSSAQLLEVSSGYRLPTEAEWERAAAWDAATSTHFAYGVSSDTLSANPAYGKPSKARANYYDASPDYVNPLGMVTMPYTSPVGWFNAINANPNGWVQTADSPSPVGCYDMSGNLYEWCHDWYAPYTADAQTNPLGPATGTHRILRGGSWGDQAPFCRTAFRYGNPPEITYYHMGFRVARYTATVAIP